MSFEISLKRYDLLVGVRGGRNNKKARCARGLKTIFQKWKLIYGS